MRGRPLRFLGVTLGGWAGGRVILLWPAMAPLASPLPALVRAIAPPAAAALVDATMVPAPPPPGRASAPPSVGRPTDPAATTAPASAPAARTGDPRRIALALAGIVRHGPEIADVTATLPPPLPPTPRGGPGRLAGSAWLIARDGASGGTIPGARLGGSQAGARLTFALDARRRVALAGRVSAPLTGRGREAALGIEWRPTDAPVRVLAEQRWSLDGGRGGPTVMLVAGLDPTPVGPLRLEAYGQAGAIARGRVDGFADGAARLALPLVRGDGLRLDLGVGAWGGAQPGATRLDLGPSIGIGLPAARRRIRVTLDWRQRVAGDARPGSGPAVSIGSDF